MVCAACLTGRSHARFFLVRRCPAKPGKAPPWHKSPHCEGYVRRVLRSAPVECLPVLYRAFGSQYPAKGEKPPSWRVSRLCGVEAEAHSAPRWVAGEAHPGRSPDDYRLEGRQPAPEPQRGPGRCRAAQAARQDGVRGRWARHLAAAGTLTRCTLSPATRRAFSCASMPRNAGKRAFTAPFPPKRGLRLPRDAQLAP